MLSTDLAELKAYMTENPGAVIEDVARERKVTPRAVLEALPETMVRIGPGSEFGAAMNDVAQWGEVTLIVHTDDAIFEFTGSIPAGEVGRGYFNLMQPKGLARPSPARALRGDRLCRTSLHGQIVGLRRVRQCGRRHHVQGVRRPRRDARAARRPVATLSSVGRKDRARPRGVADPHCQPGRRSCSEQCWPL